jgi:cellulose synthase/poly-beta-1,6-N-acetylglucosamine synthase-like glycosyltransferase
MIRSVYQTYISRFPTFPKSISEPPEEETSLMICLPAINEPHILNTLEALARCDAPKGKVELIICINAPEGASMDTLSQNAITYEQVIRWAGQLCPSFMRMQVLRYEQLPRKHAGAGWARKIAMDEALGRWALLERDGPIVCLDADCTVSGDYLVKIEEAFRDPEVKLGHMEFYHPFEQEEDPILRRGIVFYELHLRCHIAGLSWAGYPFAVHTVGSCMAVRASQYAKEGGMNRRKAGEDFYFMHKLLPLGGYMAIPATVYPSCRVSDRVPFGTGRSQLEWASGGVPERLTYSVSIYRVLKGLFKVLQESFKGEVALGKIELKGFFPNGQLEEMLTSFRIQSGNEEIYFRRLWQWMDGFTVLKLTHHLRDHGHPNVQVSQVAEELIRIGAFSAEERSRVEELLSAG